MRVLVCGGRDFSDYSAVQKALDTLYLSDKIDCFEVIQGGAAGADRLARDWCANRCVRYYHFPADWQRHGRAAGPIRNQTMLDEGKPDLVLAFKGGRGTADMVRRATAAGVPVQHVE